MVFRIAAAARDAGQDAVFDRADAGSGPGTLKIYTGSQPANGDTAASGTLLVTFTLNDPAFLPSSGGVKAIDVDPAVSAVATAAGTAGWGRIQDSAGNNVFDGLVNTTTGDFVINATAIALSQTITLTGGSITDPA